MKTAFIALLLALLPAVGFAQDCTPLYVSGMTAWSDDVANRLPFDASSQVVADTNNAHIFSNAVPAGRILLLRTAALSTAYGGDSEYMIEHLINVPGGYHYHEIARGRAAGTPALHVPSADLRSGILLAGERLGFRSNPGGPIIGMWSGFSLPEGCLKRVLGLETPVVSSASNPPPNLTNLLAAAEAAATALTSLAESVP